MSILWWRLEGLWEAVDNSKSDIWTFTATELSLQNPPPRPPTTRSKNQFLLYEYHYNAHETSVKIYRYKTVVFPQLIRNLLSLVWASWLCYQDVRSN